jgi:hypothetical protein
MRKTLSNPDLSNRCDNCGHVKKLKSLHDGLCRSCNQDAVAFVAHHPRWLPQSKRDESPERKPQVVGKDKSLSKKYKVSSSDGEEVLERCEKSNCPHLITIEKPADRDTRRCDSCHLIYCGLHLSASHFCSTCEALDMSVVKISDCYETEFQILKTSDVFDWHSTSYNHALAKFAELLQVDSDIAENLKISAATRKRLELDVSKPPEYVEKLRSSWEYREHLLIIQTLRYRKELLQRQIDHEEGSPI